MKKFLLLFLNLTILFSLMTPLALAQEEVEDLIRDRLEPVEDVYNPKDDVTGDTFAIAIARIIRVVLGFLAIIFLALIVYAGFMWMTSRGNEQAISKAKGTMVAAVVGVAIIITAYAITSFVLTELIEATSGR